MAIELAAARVRVLGVEQIAARLDDHLRLLTGGNRSAAPRHRTLRAAINWSYELLTEPERHLFDRLSVFAGGWTLEAAEAICGGDGIETEEVVEVLAGLVDKSLVLAEPGDYRVTRYSLLMGRGGTPYAQFWRLTYTQMRDRLLGTGQVTPEELDRLDALFDDPEFIWMDAVLMTVLGRRPIG